MPLATLGKALSGPISGGFSPSQLDLWGWWDLQAETGESEGVGIETLTDRSGNSRDLTQVSGSQRPVFRASGLNGYPAAELDGSNDFWSRSIGTTIPSPFTLIAVASHAAIGVDTFILSSSPQSYIATDGADPDHAFMNGSGGSNITASPTISLNTAFQLLGIFNGASSKIRFNGVQTAGTTGTGGFGGTLYIGYNGGVDYYTGKIGELLITNTALTTDEVTLLEAFLTSKWNL